MKASHLFFAALLAGAIAVPTAASAEGTSMAHQTTPVARLPVEGDFPSLGGATGWLNSPPLSAAALRGKVVLVEFWNFTCINWLRTMPYIRAWAASYADQGLVVIGVHAPEFDVEHDLDNVGRAAQALRVDFPIAIDNDYAVWHAFHNQYWPALYFIDARGQIRHRHFGEGDYAGSEQVIRQLLAEAGTAGAGHEPVSVEAQGVEAPADWAKLKSPETYLGYDRAENFVSPGGALLAKPRLYAVPARLRLNNWALAGDWTIGQQAAVLNKSNGRIAYRFHARDLHLVLAPAADGQAIRFRVRIDGAAPGADHGLDVDAEGWGSVEEPRLYQLVRQTRPFADRTFEIEFLDSGVRAYVFTFG